ncbi:MAG TPA: hypothetical protein PKA41_00035 [Verrucomicrobiota bacterium]|nr:hypothetical protein [Verrucomicrobiota bacterium]
MEYRRVPTRFGPETRFEVRPFRAVQETELERLKNRLLQQRLGTTTAPELNARLRRAANEAAALAWITPFPLLMFPALFEEIAQTARVQAARQFRIRERSRELLAA